MKTIVLAVLALSAVSLSAQAPAPSDSGKLFQRPPVLSGQSPQFKLQMPIWSLEPHTVWVQPQTPAIDTHIDQAMVIHPPEGLFAQQPGLPALSQNLYPGLKILPTELANVAPLPTLWPNAKVIPIPITWPHAKVEPIPTSTNGFRAVPVHSLATPARK